MLTIKKTRPDAGITLVEVLVAAGVLSLLLGFGYKIFFGMSASFQKGSWALATQNRLRNGLAFIREEMQKASYRSDVRVNGTTVTIDGFRFSLNSADEVTADAVIASWSIGVPYRNGGDGGVYNCEFKLEGGRLIYNKVRSEGTDNTEKEFTNYVVSSNVEKIKLNLEEFDPDKPLAGKLITFEVAVVHEDKVRHPDAKVIAQTGAKVEVEVIR